MKKRPQFDPSIYDVDYEPIPSDFFVLNPNSTDVFHYPPDDPRWPKRKNPANSKPHVLGRDPVDTNSGDRLGENREDGTQP